MGDVALVIKRSFNATPEALFDAWTDAKQVEKWYGPEGFTNTVHTFDAREGGEYRVTMHGKDGDHTVRGVFKTLERPKKLVITWQWESSGDMEMSAETLVTVEFNEVGGKTEMTMTHAGFADEKQKEMHNQGWSSSLNKLEKALA